MPFTGERIVTGFTNHYGVTEHLHRYAIALKFCSKKDVLDIASGEGYGSNLISKIANKVIGVDISEDAIYHSKRKYRRENLNFKIGTADKIPLGDNSIDVVVSFETIEHHDKHVEMLTEIKRVLRKDGLLIISSPEKSIYFERDNKNPFHIKELTSNEFLELSKLFFKECELHTQRFIHASFVAPVNNVSSSNFQIYGGNYNHINQCLNENYEFYNKPYFNIIIASDFPINYNYSSIFDGADVIYEESSFYKNRSELLYNSTSYKIGNFIVKLFMKIPFIKNFKK